jgi:glycosyltransferase involved in cell wall biosynthesis
MIWPIYIPSKGRPNPATAKTLAAIPHTLIVEPQDMGAYARVNEIGSKLLSLQKDNQGIAYVRNFVLNLCRELNHKWFWMLDDDITGFNRSEGGRNHKTDPAIVLAEAQKIFQSLGQVGQGALEYQQFSWSAKKEHAIGYCDVAVAINVERTKNLNYRPEMNLKEDRDFTLQVLASGMLTVRSSKLSFAAPKNGSNKGGLYDIYRSGLEKTASQRMEDAWPNICKATIKKDGRPDVKINWAAFRPK